MAFISFEKSAEYTWQTRSWAFRQLVEDVGRAFSGDEEIREELAVAEAFDGLSLYMLPNYVARKLSDDLRKVVSVTLDQPTSSSIMSKAFSDEETIHQYLNSIKELQAIISSYDSKKSIASNHPHRL